MEWKRLIKKEKIISRGERKLTKSIRNKLGMCGELANDTIDNYELLDDLYTAIKKYGDVSNSYMAAVLAFEKLYNPEYPQIVNIKNENAF